MIYRIIRQLILLIILLLSQPLLMLAQVNQTTQTFHDFLDSLQAAPKQGQGNIIIKQDTRLFNSVLRLNDINSKKKGVAGYRINLFTVWAKGGGRSKAEAEKLRFMAAFEDIPAYTIWDPPRFIIYVGDFYTRSDAEKALQKIHKLFPKAFVRVARVRAPDI
jgi:hypothetical protein